MERLNERDGLEFADLAVFHDGRSRAVNDAYAVGNHYYDVLRCYGAFGVHEVRAHGDQLVCVICVFRIFRYQGLYSYRQRAIGRPGEILHAVRENDAAGASLEDYPEDSQEDGEERTNCLTKGYLVGARCQAGLVVYGVRFDGHDYRFTTFGHLVSYCGGHVRRVHQQLRGGLVATFSNGRVCNL